MLYLMIFKSDLYLKVIEMLSCHASKDDDEFEVNMVLLLIL